MSDQNSPLFLTLVYQFQHLAMVALGKLPGPDGKIGPIDLDAVQFSIQMLEMLEKKCKGNLTNDEERILQNELTNLRLNYVEEYNKSTSKNAAETK
ncbi:MAG: DUF1844 domain-containing protein [bacterium]|nr:DUF1844 domain-containing protein [bacterium]